MKVLYRIAIISILALMHVTAQAGNGFAIVIDPSSYAAAKAEVDAYASAVSKADGYKVIIVEDVWGVPDSIRAVLQNLHKASRNPIVGAVFVGDIPVAMVRGAQHLASAFKMDEERYSRDQSSIPSDRFYDDFSLKFDYIGRDEGTPLYYYQLTADSAQRLSPDIFSGRIRPMDENGKVRIDALKAFLLKAAEARLNPPVMDQMLFFSGHGYISESKTARLDEKKVWLEHFPALNDGRNHISYIDYSDAVPVKSHLMNEIMRPELNVAVLHHHGAPDTEYLNAAERPYMVRDAKEYMIKNLRDHVYRARQKGKDYNKVIEDFKESFDVPDSWFKDVFNEEVHKADSLNDASLDLYLEDFAGYGYKPAAQLVILDACYNGSYHLNNCIADEYIFQEGGTVAVQANSVNSLQDKWHDRFFGIVAAGGCAGDLVRYAPYIESHLIGDPTFRFACTGDNLDDIILKDSKSAWEKLLRKGTPDQKALALEHLYRKGAVSSSRLLDIYKDSPYAVVRTEALYCLYRANDDNLVTALSLAMDDADEFIRRISVKLAGKTGDVRLVPDIVKVFLTNNATSRVVFNTSYALLSFPKDTLYAEFDRQIAGTKMVNRDSEAAVLRSSFERSVTRFLGDEASITDPATEAKERRSNIRQIRSNLCYANVPALLDYLRTCGDADTQVLLLEALGWHRLAWNSADIAMVAYEMSRDEALPLEVRNEALKTYNRVTR
ncbi:MAG: HEAT repeat domain-containing protein [Bacteroidales bacterium]|nr:HEAT repeat domain-containing protein [Bacteroidales bacterium]